MLVIQAVVSLFHSAAAAAAASGRPLHLQKNNNSSANAVDPSRYPIFNFGPRIYSFFNYKRKLQVGQRRVTVLKIITGC